MALETVTLRIDAVDFTTGEATAYAVITPTRTVRDPDTGTVAVAERELLPLGSGTARIDLVATGQGKPDDWHYRVEVYAVDPPGRMDAASPKGHRVVSGLVLLPAGDEHNLADLEMLDTPDVEVTYPRLDELLAALESAASITAETRNVLDDIRDTDLGTVVTDVQAVADAAAASAQSAADAADAAAFNVDSVRDAAEQATTDVASMRQRLPERDAQAVGKGELVINAADYPTVQAALDATPAGGTAYFPPGDYRDLTSNAIRDPRFLDPGLRAQRESWSSPYAGFTRTNQWYGNWVSSRPAKGIQWLRFGDSAGGEERVQVTAGTVITCSARMYITTSSTPDVRWAGYWFNTAGDRLNSTVAISPDRISRDWATLTATLTVPDGATGAVFGIGVTGETGAIYLSDPVVQIGSVAIPSDITIRGDGPHTRFVTTANNSAFTLDPRTENVVIRDVTIAGSMPEDPTQQSLRHQVGIDAMEPSLEAPLTNIRIQGCTFDGLEGFGIRLKHPQGLFIEDNVFNRCGYAAVGTYSANQGSISDNTITGTGIPPPWQGSGNTYGVFLSFHEPDNNNGIPAPRPCDITVHGNIVRNQAWECLDTHSGERISFIGNHLYDFPDHGIAAVGSGQQADGSFSFGVTDIVIADNIVIGRGPGRTQMGIRLRGGADAGAEWASGTITGNLVKWCGAHNDTNTYFAAVQLAYARGVAVSGNVIIEARCNSVVLHNCRSVVASGNSIIDVHRYDGQRAPAFWLARTRAEPCDVMLANNRLSRGSMPLAAPVTNISDAAWVAEPNTAVHTVIDGGNYWGFSPEIAYSSGTHTIFGAGRTYNETWGTAPPTWGSWSIGDRCWNQDPRANGRIGWVCTISGSPGTWRPWGNVNLG